MLIRASNSHLYFIPEQVRFYSFFSLHGSLKICLKAQRVEDHHFLSKCLHLMVLFESTKPLKIIIFYRNVYI